MQFPQAPKSEDQVIDDRLASLTNQVLAGEMGELTEMNGANTAKLSHTLLRLYAALRVEKPGATTAARIRARLQREWQHARQRSAPKWLRLAFAGALAGLLLIAVVALGTPSAEALPGAAVQFPAWSLLLGGLGIILIAFLIWIDHRR